MSELIKVNEKIYRVLIPSDSAPLAIDCMKRDMPKYLSLSDGEPVTEADLYRETGIVPRSMDELSPEEKRIAYERYTKIAGALAVVGDKKKRSQLIDRAAEQYNISKQTIRSWLCSYLVYQTIAVLAPAQEAEKELTQDEKNMRWALNRFFYTQNENSLQTAYTMLLKERYTGPDGKLMESRVTFNQFRYFYRKTRKMENFYISRQGIKDYQKNCRPLLGDGVQEYAPNLGTAMLDGTICDIYLVNDAGELVGRPLVVVACDANTSLCLGYSLMWEGGVYSLQNLMLNVISDKVELCQNFGIEITKEQWNVDKLPGIMVSDGGSEYTGEVFQRVTELGVSLEKLPPWRPELKGPVEKLFDLVQSSYKDMLKGRGIIMPDFRERGAHDYRTDACITMKEFERILVRCIVFYNSERVLKSYPYTQEMLDLNIRPHASDIWNYKLSEQGTNLITVSRRDLTLTLFPRTAAKFTRYGLKVNKLRYYADGYKEAFLTGGTAVVAYNPDDVSKVWLKESDGSFVEFSLIESRYMNMSLDAAAEMQDKQKGLIATAAEETYQAKVELMNFIESVASGKQSGDVKLKDIRTTRQHETRKRHKDLGGMVNG